ncbi:MAG: ribonucleoside-triphosphate reductase, adenosylcobalamin-dependent [Aeriscardovia sp.]|nr:ribonucleoside-triphosphate reductase, adenosylcobalamin-dependent [Aeriscardovia sp.]
MRITLSNEFIDKQSKTIQPHWGPLGWVTYKRTYARFLEDKGRTEEWPETVKRVVEGNINLDPRLKGDPAPSVAQELTGEAENLYKLIYGLAATPSGRNLWVSGTPYQEKHGDALNNCWFIAIRPQKYGDSRIVPGYLDSKDEIAVSMPWAFMFDELMKGGGVGFSVTHDNVSKIPQVKHEVQLACRVGKENASAEECRNVGAYDTKELCASKEWVGSWIYEVEDSREGWVNALAAVIDSHFKDFPRNRVIIDVSNVRPRGARIHGFGGTASGAAPLVEMLYDVNRILNQKAGERLTSVDCTDISNLIGKAVVAGNVRRSAELALGDWDDDGFRTMKQDQEKLAHHRWASNNSVVVDGKPEQYEQVAHEVIVNGEPGVVDLNLSRHYGRLVDGYKENADPRAEGTNPCGEITLENGEPCNLFEIFPAIAQEQGWRMSQVTSLAVRYAKRVTFGSYDWEVSRNAITRNRRLGVSLSGIQDWFLSRFGQRCVTGWEEEDGKRQPVYDMEIARVLDSMYRQAVAADEEYSAQLGCEPNIKLTTVKPSGTVAKLAGVSEGMHFQWAGHFIQRIRFQDNDPLLEALKKCGYHMEPDVYTKHTMVVEFPVKAAHWQSDSFASAGTVSAEEQLATQAFLQKYWSDNAVSCTVTFQKKEEAELPSILAEFAGRIKSTSLLGYVDGGYKQMPKETIGAAQYEERMSLIHDDPQKVFNRLREKEDEDMTLVDLSDCAGGACPVR